VEDSDLSEVDELLSTRSDLDELDEMLDVAWEAVEAFEVVGDSRLDVSSLLLVDTED